MDKYYNEKGQVAVLISRGYGAGWSSWNNSEHREFLCMDKKLVEMKVNSAPYHEVKSYVKTVIKNPSMAGWSEVDVEFINKGSSFTISEYDGSESIEMISDLAITA